MHLGFKRAVGRDQSLSHGAVTMPGMYLVEFIILWNERLFFKQHTSV